MFIYLLNTWDLQNNFWVLPTKAVIVKKIVKHNFNKKELLLVCYWSFVCYGKKIWIIEKDISVRNVPVSHELDKCVPPEVFTYFLSY